MANRMSGRSRYNAKRLKIDLLRNQVKSSASFAELLLFIENLRELIHSAHTAISHAWCRSRWFFFVSNQRFSREYHASNRSCVLKS